MTVEYQDDKPVRVETVVLSTQHSPDVEMDQLRRDLLELVIRQAIPAELLDENTKYYINPTGRFVIGGPAGDSGLTGRKIIVDTYGGYARHGGGAFSGKDPTKVDRSGAYMARYVAKNIVAAGLAKKCEVQLSYAIGVAQPVSALVETFGTETAPAEAIEKAVRQCFDLRPTAIINALNLRRPIFQKTSAYGHFGRNEPEFTWEQCDKAEALRQAVQDRRGFRPRRTERTAQSPLKRENPASGGCLFFWALCADSVYFQAAALLFFLRAFAGFPFGRLLCPFAGGLHGVDRGPQHGGGVGVLPGESFGNAVGDPPAVFIIGLGQQQQKLG